MAGTLLVDPLAVTFAWMLCNKLFGLNQDTTAALVNFLKLFRNKGLRCYQGETVALARKALWLCVVA